MHFRLFFYFTLYCLCFVQAQAQTPELDSLKQALTNIDPSDTKKHFHLLADLYSATSHIIPNEAINYAKKAIEISSEFSHTDKLAYLYYGLAYQYSKKVKWDSCQYYLDRISPAAAKNDSVQLRILSLKGIQADAQGNYQAAIQHYEQATKLPLFKAWPQANSSIYASLGRTCAKQSNYTKAMNYFQMSLESYALIKDYTAQIDVYSDIAALCEQSKLYDQQLFYLKKGEQLARQHQFPVMLARVLGELGNYHQVSNNSSLTLAAEYSLEQKNLSKDLGLLAHELNALLRLSNILREQGQLMKAEGYYEEARNLLGEQLEHTDDLDFFYYSTAAELHYAKNQYAQALVLADSMLQLATERERLDGIEQAQGIRSKVYEAQGKLGAALSAYKIYHQTQDSIDATELGERITALEAQLTNSENERAIINLKTEKQLLEASKQLSRTIIIGMTILFFFGLGFLWNMRRKNSIISAQNEGIRTRNQQLAQLNMTKDRIFAILAHDMRKPVLAFRGIPKKVNYLLRKQDYSTLNALGNEIEHEAQQLSNITDNLLNWALTQKNVMPYQPMELELRPLSEEVVELFKQPLSEKNLDFKNSIAIDLSVYADRNGLVVIIRNLLDNAIKYTPTGGQIFLKAKSCSEGVSIQVQDTGVGIPKERLKDIFLLQKDKSTQGTAGEKGTGLGLHLIKELVQLNKGKIQVSSELNKGTTFNINLPMAPTA